MTDIHITKRTAVLKAVNLRKEFHGEETEKAMDLTLVLVVDAKSIAGLFAEEETVLDHLWTADGMPLLGSWELKHRFKIDGIAANVDRFTFEGCTIKKGLVARPAMNRAFEITAKLQVHPGDRQKCADHLWSFREEEIKVELQQMQTNLELGSADTGVDGED